MKALIYGNITLDENISDGQKYSGPGGSSFFISQTFDRLGVDNTICSPYGKDFAPNYLSNVKIFPPNPSSEKTLTFQNLSHGTKRVQRVFNVADSQNIPPKDIPQELLKETNICL